MSEELTLFRVNYEKVNKRRALPSNKVEKWYLEPRCPMFLRLNTAPRVEYKITLNK